MNIQAHIIYCGHRDESGTLDCTTELGSLAIDTDNAEQVANLDAALNAYLCEAHTPTPGA